jgi:hypothetical protein
MACRGTKCEMYGLFQFRDGFCMSCHKKYLKPEEQLNKEEMKINAGWYLFFDQLDYNLRFPVKVVSLSKHSCNDHYVVCEIIITNSQL